MDASGVSGLTGNGVRVDEEAPCQFRAVLDLPLSAGEARNRGLGESVFGLVLAPRDRRQVRADRVAPVFARWVARWKDPGLNVYLMPILLFASQGTLVSLVTRGYIRHWRVSDEPLVACQDESALGIVFQELRCEELGILYARDDAMAEETARTVAGNQSRLRSHNAPFLARLEHHGGFVFFSDTHLSLEVLGTAEFVYDRCFAPVAAWLLRRQ